MGDIVHALPVARMLRLHWPNIELGWWIDATWAPLLQKDPDITSLYLFHRQNGEAPSTWWKTFRSLLSMRLAGFDLAIDLQALLRSGLAGWYARPKLFIGLEDLREGAPTFYDIAIPRPTPHTHAVDWCLQVLEVLGIHQNWDFEWLPVDPEAFETIRRRWPDQEKTLWIGIQPGGRWESKRWPSWHFAELIRSLAQWNPQLRFVIFGSPSEWDLAVRVAAGAPERCEVVAGQLSLPQLVEWIRRCRLFITNDSGPMHIAAALRRPVLALFGPTDPRRTGPYKQQYHVLRLNLDCSPCLRRRCRHRPRHQCLLNLSPETVYEQATRILSTEPEFVEAPWRTTDQWGRMVSGSPLSKKEKESIQQNEEVYA